MSHLSRRRFLKLSALTAASVSLSCARGDMKGQPKASRPNILYIFTDDQSYRTISCYPGAYAFADTPNIDTLAQKGVLFTQAYIGAKCVPSRACTLTGRLQHHVNQERYSAGKEGKCNRYWPQDFRQQGYTTGMIGKWHWGKGTDMHCHGDAWDWSVVWDHGQKKEKGTYYWGQSVNINGGEPVKLEGYSTDRYTEYTVDFIKARAKTPDKPWYFWLCYSAVHAPYTPAERHEQLYLDAPETKIPVDIYGPRPDMPKHMVNWEAWTRGEDGKPMSKGRSLDAWVKQYNQTARAIDEGVGRIIEALEKTGQIDNTIIIFTSDQGYAWGQHGLRDKKYPYDVAIRAPFIVSNPKRYPVNKICKQPISGLDVVRTMHTMAGVTPGIQLDGRDFSALLKNPDIGGQWTDEPMLQMYTNNLYNVEDITKALQEEDWQKFVIDKKRKSKVWIMLHTERYKYVRYVWKNYIEELYDLQADPDELKNLAVRKEYHQILADLRKQAVEAFRAKGATFVDLLPKPKIVSK